MIAGAPYGGATARGIAGLRLRHGLTSELLLGLVIVDTQQRLSVPIRTVTVLPNKP